MTIPRSRPVPWDIYEELLDEASFLWSEWESALGAASYTLDEVANGPEARLLVHLDGLVLGGKAVAERLLLAALASDEPARVAVAAWALLQAEDGDHQDSVLNALAGGEPNAVRAIARALHLSANVDVSRVARLWRDATPEVRAVAFELVAAREPAWARENLESMFRRAETPSAVVAALRVLRQIPDQRFTGYVEDALEADGLELRREAVLTGVLLGSREAWECCRQMALRAHPASRLALGLLATSVTRQDRTLVLASAHDDSTKRDAVWALGFTGDLEAADFLAETIADPVVGKTAAEALSAISGVLVEGAFVSPANTSAPDPSEVGPDDPPPVVRAEDHLPRPNVAAIRAWWSRERSRFAAGQRWLFGRERNAGTLRFALGSAPMWRRDILSIELAVVARSAVAVDVRAWTRDQRASLAQVAAAHSGAATKASRGM